jgi:hypothetical protein
MPPTMSGKTGRAGSVENKERYRNNGSRHITDMHLPRYRESKASPRLRCEKPHFHPWHVSCFPLYPQGLPARRNSGGGWNLTGSPFLQIVRIAAILCLSATLAQAEEMSGPVPIFSGDDGRAWVEVSRSGNRAKAVPVLEISGKTVRKMTAGDDTEPGFLAPPAKDGKKGVKVRTDIRDLVERNKSLVVREGPDGVSLGNAFDLMGEIHEALKKGRGKKEKVQGVFRALKQVPDTKKPVSATAEAADSPVAFRTDESGSSASGGVRPGLVSR